MAFQVLTSDSIGTGVRITLANEDDLYIGRDVTVARTDATNGLDLTITGTGSQHRVDVAGTVLGPRVAIKLGDAEEDFGNIVSIAASGVVRGYEFASTGIWMEGRENQLINAGDVWTSNVGVIMYSYGETISTITNSGTIEGKNFGVTRPNQASVNGIISLVNSGTISGKAASYDGLPTIAKDLITNTGHMIGNIYLGGGMDVYDGTNGRLSGEVYGGEGDDEIRGGIDNDRLYGDAGIDKLYGGSGNDTLNGGTDRDFLYGGAGNDTFIVDNAGDKVIENASEGTDLVQASVGYTLATNVENLTLTGTAKINGSGNSLANVLIGNTADNVLDGKAGADKMQGGKGNDTYIVDNLADTVAEKANEGIDLVQASVSYTLAANIENLTLAGAAKINGTGNTLANVLFGNAADNVLDGKAGADKMQGGKGNDTYIVDNLADAVAEKANEGIDLVKASVNTTLSVNVENLTLTGTGNINGTGNALANVIKGTTGINTLKGEAGNDMLYGGTGADKLYGGLGADTFVFMSATDSTVASSGRDTIYDFSRAQGDKINLKAIDASTKSGGDQAFTFIGAEKFHKKAGELRFEKKSGDTFIQGDVNGDGKADFSIMLDLSLTMSKSDFIL
ncbi:calcium-binding protein [Rhizobium sp. ARZ01]|uniref:calcium-binding protein n=1 Tax=Rhizobium sp. ARZ01 TaxID=2769313 RepID=UPI0017804862|nr:calcium-binding protein [Rhizobium sp. ARZ01]MBD9375671.1 calcium-binding protein [Rhizobium sp. ARZ01]